MSQVLRPLFVMNTLTGRKERLETLRPGVLTFYSCGPTVYGSIHLGNLRGALVADLFVRYWRKVGYEVIYVRNYTDVDDKIIRRAQEEGCSCSELTHRVIQEVEREFALCHLLPPTHVVKATEHVSEMIALIQRLIDQGHAYIVSTGEVFYSIETFKNYGTLSHKKQADLLTGARVEVNPHKKNSADFTLWKPVSSGDQRQECVWESPWGPGRPGWHIECSAMAQRWIGAQIDVHHGGEDLIFPHHENEIAQSEGASGCQPFSRYWLHHAFLNFSQEKMSKSLGNVVTARDFLARYGGEVARFFLLSSHYRSSIDLSPAHLDQSLQALQRLYEAKQKAQEVLNSKATSSRYPFPVAECAWGEFLALCQQAETEIDEAYAQDFHTPGVLAAVFRVIREWNRFVLEQPQALQTPGCLVAAQRMLSFLEEDLGSVLGVGRLPASSFLVQLAQMRAGLEGKMSLIPESEIRRALEERTQARKDKNFQKSDQIRASLEAQGVLILDSPEGTSWRYR